MKFIISTITRTCPLCGLNFKTNSPVRKYCKSQKCAKARLAEKNRRRRNRRRRLSKLGIKLHHAGNT